MTEDRKTRHHDVCFKTTRRLIYPVWKKVKLKVNAQVRVRSNSVRLQIDSEVRKVHCIFFYLEAHGEYNNNFPDSLSHFAQKQFTKNTQFRKGTMCDLT